MKRVVPAGLAHPALLLLLLAGRSVGTQATWARGSPEGWVERGGLSCSAPSASLSLCWFLFCVIFFFPPLSSANQSSHLLWQVFPFTFSLLSAPTQGSALEADSLILWGWGGVSLSSGLLWLYYFKFWDGCQEKKRPCLLSPSPSFLPTCTACWNFSFVERKSSGWLRSLR